jgi:hypothetical protein
MRLVAWVEARITATKIIPFGRCRVGLGGACWASWRLWEESKQLVTRDEGDHTEQEAIKSLGHRSSPWMTRAMQSARDDTQRVLQAAEQAQADGRKECRRDEHRGHSRRGRTGPRRPRPCRKGKAPLSTTTAQYVGARARAESHSGPSPSCSARRDTGGGNAIPAHELLGLGLADSAR